MRRHYKAFLALAATLLLLGFSSCFDIYEEYTFNADGSGKARFEVDISKMMAFMEGMGGALDSTGGDKATDLESMFTDSKDVDALKDLPGISNVTNISNRESSTVGVSFEFASVEALNMALIARGNDMGMGAALGMQTGGAEEGSTDNNTIAFDGKRFKRTLDMKMDEQKEDEDGEEAQAAEMAKMMFKDAKYTVKYIFPKSVKKIKGNDVAVIGADKKSVTIENSLADLLEGKSTMTADIRLK